MTRAPSPASCLAPAVPVTVLPCLVAAPLCFVFWMRPLAIQGLYLARSLFKISRWLSALGPLGCGAAHCCPAWPWAASCPVRFLATSCAGVASLCPWAPSCPRGAGPALRCCGSLTCWSGRLAMTPPVSSCFFSVGAVPWGRWVPSCPSEKSAMTLPAFSCLPSACSTACPPSAVASRGASSLVALRLSEKLAMTPPASSPLPLACSPACPLLSASSCRASAPVALGVPVSWCCWAPCCLSGKSAMTPPEFPDFSSVAASEISFS